MATTAALREVPPHRAALSKRFRVCLKVKNCIKKKNLVQFMLPACPY
jgi:hypothetical protein